MIAPEPTTQPTGAIMATKALTHGLTAKLPVIPGLERQEDWRQHYHGILASLAPQGQLELSLADRIASLLWRLHRIHRFETSGLFAAQYTVSGQRQHYEHFLNLENTDKLLRYESHLNRCLYSTMHDLEALQARRSGQPAPLARLQVTGLPEP